MIRRALRRIVLALMQITVIGLTAVWLWGRMNQAAWPGTEDIKTAALFVGFTIVAVAWGQVRLRARLSGDKPTGGGRRRSLMIRLVTGLLIVGLPAVPVVAAWTAIGWTPATAHYGLPAVAVCMVLPALVGWSLAGQVAARHGATVTVVGLWPPIRRTLLMPIVGAFAGATVWGAYTWAWGEQGWLALAGWTILGATTAAGAWAGSTIGSEKGARDQLRGPVAAGLGTTETALDGIAWRVDRARHIHIPGPLPATVISRLDGLPARLATAMPGYQVETATAGGVVLIPVTEAVKAQRALLDDTDGYVAAETAIPDAPAHRPDARLWQLTDLARISSGPAVEVQARKRGLSLVEYTPEAHTAIVAALDPDTRVLRDRVADALHVKPWDIELTITLAGDRVDVVDVLRAPVIPAQDRRLTTWRNIIGSVVPGGSLGWEIEDRPVEGRVMLRWGEQPELPAGVDLDHLLPEEYAPGEWASLPLGVGADGHQVVIDLAAGPHALIAGPTGSGKTVALLTLITGALARGHGLVLIDPTKAGLDFLSLRPYATAWADTLSEARRALELVYSEVTRRKGILKREGEVKWSDLDALTRKTEAMHPLTVLIDEFGSLVLLEAVPKSLGRDDPLREEAEERNGHREVIRSLVGRIAREARFVGIHLQIALQRPDVAIMGSGELRSNLTSAVQLAPPGRGVSGDALRMLFHADVVDAAAEELAILDDGTSRGLAVVAAEGGTARGLRVGYRPMRDIPALLEQVGVPRVAEPWSLLPVARPTPNCEPWNSRQSGTADAKGRGGAGRGRPTGNPIINRMKSRAVTVAPGEDWEPPTEPPPNDAWLTPSPDDDGAFVPPTGR